MLCLNSIGHLLVLRFVQYGVHDLMQALTRGLSLFAQCQQGIFDSCRSARFFLVSPQSFRYASRQNPRGYSEHSQKSWRLKIKGSCPVVVKVFYSKMLRGIRPEAGASSGHECQPVANSPTYRSSLVDWAACLDCLENTLSKKIGPCPTPSKSLYRGSFLLPSPSKLYRQSSL